MCYPQTPHPPPKLNPNVHMHPMRRTVKVTATARFTRPEYRPEPFGFYYFIYFFPAHKVVLSACFMYSAACTPTSMWRRLNEPSSRSPAATAPDRWRAGRARGPWASAGGVALAALSSSISGEPLSLRRPAEEPGRVALFEGGSLLCKQPTPCLPAHLGALTAKQQLGPRVDDD